MGNSIVIAEPTADGAACAVMALRASGSTPDTFFVSSQKLADLFSSGTPGRSSASPSVIICGLGVVHTSWDGRVLRPHLMQSLRDIASPIRWFSPRRWRSEDRTAVANIIGVERLVVAPDSSCAAELIADFYAGQMGEDAKALVQMAGGKGNGSAPDWVGRWRRVIAALRDRPSQIRPAIEPLVAGNPAGLDAGFLERAEAVEQTNRDTAAQLAGDPIAMRQHTLTCLAIPGERHAFWREISQYARAVRGTDFSLCRLVGRPVLVLSRDEEERVDLRQWSRYVTDVIPAARAVEPRPERIPFYVQGLAEDPGLMDDVVRALKEGAHLIGD